MKNVTQEMALQLIGRLRQGRNVIFGTNLFSVGRENWIRGADQIFEDIETTGDSCVRFIRGDYGVGKTNFAARLFEAALRRGWVAVYVELSEQVALYEFQQVFSQIVDKMYVPEQLGDSVLSPQPSGFIGVLDAYYKRVRAGVGLGAGTDISNSARTDIIARVNAVLQRARIYGEFATAMRTYLEARIDNDRGARSLVERWLRAESDSHMRGLFKPISKMTGKEHLRSLSAFLVGIGYKGTLVILDELERIMEDSPTRRRKSYTLLRELIDNVDGENGMRSTCFYAAAPPGQFESQKGFIEVEALASRIQSPVILHGGFTDYTSTIIDLDESPLTEGERIELARRVRALHGVARVWDAARAVPDERLAELIKEIASKRTFSNVRVREFCIELVGALEQAYKAS